MPHGSLDSRFTFRERLALAAPAIGHQRIQFADEEFISGDGEMRPSFGIGERALVEQVELLLVRSFP